MLFKSNNFFYKNIFYFLFFIFFVSGITVFNDYGISVDEEFQRYSGFYWLNYALQFTPFETVKLNVLNKLNDISGYTLPLPEDYPFYGVTFDLPAALLETIFNIQEPRNYFLFRHFLTFSIFFIGAIYFYKILTNRFEKKGIVFLGLLIYISAPRIFGDSFYNNKDIIFLSFVTISMYYNFRLIDNFTYKNIFYFSFFSALSCASRIFGIFLPLSFLLFKFFSFLNKKTNSDELKKILFFIISFFVIFYLFWPFIWEAPFRNFLISLNKFSNFDFQIYMLFNNKYVLTTFLPLSYLPVWIIVTTPIITMITFFVGFVYFIKRFFLRSISIKKNSIHEDFWRGNKEKKDFYIFFNFSLIAVYIILSNASLFTGWRQLYFLHFFIVYIATFGIYFLNILFKKEALLFYSLLFLILINFYQIYLWHPFQGSYFNSLVTNKKNHFEVDYWGLAGVKFINHILTLEDNKKEIKIGVSSYIPLERSLKMLKKDKSMRVKIVGQNYKKADYLFNNNMSEVNKFKNDKYLIPKNFTKIDELYLNGFIIYELYKKN